MIKTFINNFRLTVRSWVRKRSSSLQVIEAEEKNLFWAKVYTLVAFCAMVSVLFKVDKDNREKPKKHPVPLSFLVQKSKITGTEGSKNNVVEEQVVDNPNDLPVEEEKENTQKSFMHSIKKCDCIKCCDNLEISLSVFNKHCLSHCTTRNLTSTGSKFKEIMVIRRGNVTWGSNISTAELHLTEGSPNTSSTTTEELSDCFSEHHCSLIVDPEPQNQVKWKNTFHMRQMTLSNLSTASGQVRQTLSSQAAGTKLRGRYMTSASKSLDLLRLNIQNLMNKEIDSVLKKYLDKFFKPAIENIRNNLGENSVTEENIRMICRQILEDAKIQYYGGSQSRGSSPYSDSETGSIGDLRFGHMGYRSPLSSCHNKRKESDTDSEASQSIVKPRKKAVRTMANVISGISTPVKIMKLENIKREGPKWDPNRIVKSTLFIMGARANKVLGFGQTRGRLYTKHPELLKYSGDTEDKEWLSRHNLMPPTGGIAYLLLLEDIKELAESDEYRHNPNVLFGDLKGFEAPDFMLKKIRAFIAQARTDGKDFVNVAPLIDNTDITNRCNYNMDCASVIMTPPATVLGSAPGTPCEPLDPADCNSLLPSGQTQDFFPSVGSSMVLESVVFCENKPYQSLLYATGSSAYGNFPSHSIFSSILENDSSQEAV